VVNRHILIANIIAAAHGECWRISSYHRQNDLHSGDQLIGRRIVSPFQNDRIRLRASCSKTALKNIPVTRPWNQVSCLGIIHQKALNLVAAPSFPIKKQAIVRQMERIFFRVDPERNLIAGHFQNLHLTVKRTAVVDRKISEGDVTATLQQRRHQVTVQEKLRAIAFDCDVIPVFERHQNPFHPVVIVGDIAVFFHCSVRMEFIYTILQLQNTTGLQFLNHSSHSDRWITVLGDIFIKINRFHLSSPLFGFWFVVLKALSKLQKSICRILFKPTKSGSTQFK